MQQIPKLPFQTETERQEYTVPFNNKRIALHEVRNFMILEQWNVSHSHITQSGTTCAVDGVVYLQIKDVVGITGILVT